MPGDHTMLSKVPVPVFKGVNYESYEQQVEMWVEVCGVEKEKQATILWLHLSDEHASDIKTKIYNEIKAEMKTETGVKKFIEVMAKAYKPAEQNQVMKLFLEFFVKMKKNSKETIMEFVTRFDKTANAAKKKGMDMSQTILGLKLIYDANLTEAQKSLVLVEIDFDRKEEVYEKAKLGLNKYLAGMDGKESGEEKGIKLEEALEALETEEEEALLADRGYFRGAGRGGGRGGGFNGGRGGGGSWSGGGGGGWSGGGAGARAAGRSVETERNEKRPLNPKGQDGERLLCLACGSYRHDSRMPT